MSETLMEKMLREQREREARLDAIADKDTVLRIGLNKPDGAGQYEVAIRIKFGELRIGDSSKNFELFCKKILLPSFVAIEESLSKEPK